MSVHEILDLISLLPKCADIEKFVNQKTEAAYILRNAIENIELIRNNELEITNPKTEEASYLIQCLSDKFWERIHTGHFSEISLDIRKTYAITNFFKIFYLLFESMHVEQVEKCSQILDDAILLGCTQDLYEESENLKGKLIQLFDDKTAHLTTCQLPILELEKRLTYTCDISTYDNPSVFEFQKFCFDALKPALLLNTLTHWPALNKWYDLNYINRVAGNRAVPIEIGSNYTTDEWSQQIFKVRDFLSRQFSLPSANETSETKKEIEYLAQHELFDQIPALKEDIRIPDYCTLGENASAVDIKAWLGPKGTISPMHFDPKHNILCQVFGSKTVILSPPEHTQFLYPHETQFLSNTSSIDAANLDLKSFPLAAKAKFYKLTLQSGDGLYMPPKWWHYVRSESPSFSVSFWWE